MIKQDNSRDIYLFNIHESDQIAELIMVGFHGRIGPDQTPAQRSPVLSYQNRLARILSNDRLTISVVVRRKEISDEEWLHGTKIDPGWPTILNNRVIIIDEKEVDSVIRDTGATGASIKVCNFLKWSKSEDDRSDNLLTIRFGEFIAWYTDIGSANELRSQISNIARTQVIEAFRQKDNRLLKKKSFWLSRSAVKKEDMLFAVAGLREAGNIYWKYMLDPTELNEHEYLELVNDATRKLKTAANGNRI